MALEYHKKALDICEEVFGEDNPNTAVSYNNIGAVYNEKGEYDLALEYNKKAQVLSEGHGGALVASDDVSFIYPGDVLYFE